MKRITVNSNLNTIGGELDEIKPEIMQPAVFNTLRMSGWRQVPWKRYVVLSFDIISLKILNPSLTPQELEKLPSFLLFFAIQIINTKTFQPIGKVFLRESVHPEVVAGCITSFIRDLMRCEYSVVATVSRPICFFQTVLHHLVQFDSLKKKTDAHLYKVHHLKIVHLFDPINMLENTFVLFLKYALIYRKDNRDFLAKYDDCKAVMIHSTARKAVKYIFSNTNNITCAVRLFSMTCYREIQECISEGKIQNIGSAEFCAFFDVLFDSLHGDVDEYTSKINRSSLSNISPHNKIWSKALAVLASMRVARKIGMKFHTPNIIQNLDHIKINDDYEYYEALDFVTQAETENILDIQKGMEQVLEKIKQIKFESVELPFNLKNSEVTEGKYCNDSTEYVQKTNKSAGIEREDKKNKNDDFNDKIDCHLTMPDLNFEQNFKKNNSNCNTLASDDIAVNSLQNYLKKLYVTLRDSKCTDVMTLDTNIDGILDDESEFLEQTVKNNKTTENFSTRHFDKNFNYLPHFLDSNCMPKRTNYSELEHEDESIENSSHDSGSINSNETIVFKENDYIDESEIIYSKEAIVSDNSYKEHEDIECPPFNNGYKINNRYVTNKNFQETDEKIERSTLNVNVVENVLLALGYIRTSLELPSNREQIIIKIINYLRTCNVIDCHPTIPDELEDCVLLISKSLENMMMVLLNNNPNDCEKDIACINLTIIRQHLREFKQYSNKIQDEEQASTVSDIPNFFNNNTFNKNQESKTYVNNVCKNVDKITAKILPKYSSVVNKETTLKGKEIRDTSQILDDITDNTENSQNEEIHADLLQILTDIKKKIPKLDEGHTEFNDKNKMEITSDENFSQEDDEESALKNDAHPYVFDAWQITVNGAKKLFELLQKKRFKKLQMDSLNIDHIRQIMNDVRKDHGADVENGHRTKMNLINASATTYIFETHGTIIL